MYFWTAVNPKYTSPGENLAQLKNGEIVRFDRACNDRDEGALPSRWQYLGEGEVLKVNGKTIKEIARCQAQPL